MHLKILLYDDDEMLRSSIAALLDMEPDFIVSASRNNGSNVMKDIEVYEPDVVLMDIEMPVMDGIAALKNIRAMYKDLPVIMLTVFEDAENIYQAICSGASGYLLKKIEPEKIVTGIREVLSGGAPITGSIAKKVLQMMAPKPAAILNPEDALSKREVELLTLLAKGNSYKMIASAMLISIETVRTHVKNIYKKLHVNNAPGAVSKAIDLQIVR
jgi:DNA-binding NarL/FixJ family response regulator